ncbi:hypothetical protein GQ457_12G011970 [Hibiscus cannabinus]
MSRQETTGPALADYFGWDQISAERLAEASEHLSHISSHTTTTSPATTPAAPARSRNITPETPLGSTPSSSPSPPAATQSEEAAPTLQFMLLRSQLQRIEARQIHFQEEIKVFQSNLLKFLQFQFPASATFFGQPSFPPPQPSVSAAVAAQPSTHTSAKEGATKEVHFSSDDESDIFDWQSPRDNVLPIGPVTTTPAPVVSILSAAPTPTTSAAAERPTLDSPAKRKGKATAGRTFGRDTSSSPEEEADQRPAKRRRRYHVITADSDEDDSITEIPMPKPMQIYARNDQPGRVRKQHYFMDRSYTQNLNFDHKDPEYVEAEYQPRFPAGAERRNLKRDCVFIRIFPEHPNIMSASKRRPRIFKVKI